MPTRFETPSQIENRFWSTVSRTPDGCWLWNGTVTKFGYADFNLRDKHVRANRMCWQLINGPIPDGLCVCHACDNPLCVRPSHLWLGTRAENNADMTAKGRRARGEKHGWSVLTDDQIREIRSFQLSRRNGTTQQFIANKYGISVASVYLIRHKKSWSHVQ